MSNRYPGGFLTGDEPTVNAREAEGIWTLDQQAGYQGQGLWPPSQYQISRSLRFNSADSAYLSRTPASAGNRKTFTFSCWVKLNKSGDNYILGARNGTSAGQDSFYFGIRQDKIRIIAATGAGTTQLLADTNAVFRDYSAWYHVFCYVDTTQATSTNRFKIYVNGVEQTLTGTTYPSQNTDLVAINTTIDHRIGSINFSGGTSYFNYYLTEIHFVDGQALTPSDFGGTNPTTGVWEPLPYIGTYGTNGFYLPFSDNSSEITVAEDFSGNGNNWNAVNINVSNGNSLASGTASGSAMLAGFPWSNAFDGSYATRAVAVQQTGASATYTFTTPIPFTSLKVVAACDYNGDAVRANGVALTGLPSFASWNANNDQVVDVTSQVSSPLTSVNVSWGTTAAGGSLAAVIVDDVVLTLPAAAGAGNDSLVDTPTPYGTDTGGVGGTVRGNYCTLNALDTGLTLSQGNLGFTAPSSTVFRNARSTIFVTSNKWYWEVTCNTYVSGGAPWMFGVTTSKAPLVGSGFTGDIATSGSDGSAYSSDGNKRQNGTTTAYGSTFTTGDIIGVALDMDNGKIWFSKNGVWQASGDPAAGTNAAFTNLSGLNLTPAVSLYANETSGIAYTNFGQRPFAYTAPSGFKALCTQNLPTPTVVQGDDYFNTVLYTGNGSTQSITGVGFQPDWVWVKQRSGTRYHSLYDAVRGADLLLKSNTTDAEANASGTGLTSFDSDGFSIGSDWGLNENTYTYVGWNWNAGGSNATNTDGTITSTVRANPTAGFSIVSYTGTGANATVGHGLGVAPSMIIIKDRTSGTRTVSQWPVYHTSVGNTKALFLNVTDAAFTDSTYWQNTTPTSSVFSIGSWGGLNYSGDAYIAYAFAEVEGFSKIGSYTGNGSTDGPFVYCGFRPAYVVAKRTDTTAQWPMWDAVRNPYNAADKNVWADSNEAEFTSTGYQIDILSNGFKLRNSHADRNASGGTYIFMAFAESPFKYSLAR